MCTLGYVLLHIRCLQNFVQRFVLVFIRYVLLQDFVPYLGPFYLISLINLTRAYRGFVLSGLENSRGLPKNKIRHSDPSVDKTIEIV